MVTGTEEGGSLEPSPSPLSRRLAHPVAIGSVAVILLVVYGWIFVVHPQRSAPSSDPAYYSWRIEMLISQKPSALLHLTGPFKLFEGEYRVAGTVLGSYLRRVAGVSLVKSTVLLVLGQWTVIALLLAGFAYRHRRDPLIFYSVAAAAGSLLMTPPFGGYEDNVLCLLFLAAAIWFIPAADNDPRARLGLGIFLVVAGFTHPTTLAIFCIAIVVMAALRVVVARESVRAGLRSQAPVLLTAGLALLIVYLSWTVGIWGLSQSLSAAALPPPKTKAAFQHKTLRWVKAMSPVWNGPLLVIGIIGAIIILRKRGGDEQLSRVSIGWLIPLIGVLGFLLPASYPFYRFFNSTLAWVLLIGLGAYFVIRYCLEAAGRGGLGRLGIVGALAVCVAIGATFAQRLTQPVWNRPDAGWLTSAAKQDLDSLRFALERRHVEDRAVVFVADIKAGRPAVIYGFAKNRGNISRYGLPQGEIDSGHLYLGSLKKFLAGKPSGQTRPLFGRLSRGFLEETQRGIDATGKPPIVVLEQQFNVTGKNARFFEGTPLPASGSRPPVWVVADGRVTTGRGVIAAPPLAPPAWWHVAEVLGGLALLLLPGFIGTRRLISKPSVADMVGMVPALSMALLALSGIVVLAVARAPFSGAIPWISLGLSFGVARLLPRGRGSPA